MVNRRFVLKVMSFMLCIAIMISITSPVFSAPNVERISRLSVAEQKLFDSVTADAGPVNFSELSAVDQKLFKRVIKEPHRYLVYSSVWEGQVGLIFDTPEVDVKMVIVDGFVEIIRKKDDNTFLINGEEHYFEIVKHTEYNEEVTLRYIPDYVKEIGYDPGCTFVYAYTDNIDVRAAKKFADYTAWALSVIIGSYIGPFAGAAFGFACLLIGSPYSDSDAAVIIRQVSVGSIDHPPLKTYWRAKDYCYASWQGDPKYLGLETTYYISLYY